MGVLFSYVGDVSWLGVVFLVNGCYSVDMNNLSTFCDTSLGLPSVVCLEEAAQLAGFFDHVLSAGPDVDECDFGHPDHLVVSFGDTVFPGLGPSLDHVDRMLGWAEERSGSMLVHCHMGISRSTATAIGVALGRGFSVEEAVEGLLEAHPVDSRRGRRSFRPNQLLLKHVGEIYGVRDLTKRVYRLVDGLR